MSNPRQIPKQDRWRLYELEKQNWLANNPQATYEQIQQAIRQIANRCGV